MSNHYFEVYSPEMGETCEVVVSVHNGWVFDRTKNIASFDVERFLAHNEVEYIATDTLYLINQCLMYIDGEVEALDSRITIKE